jgi:hypothetical protein
MRARIAGRHLGNKLINSPDFRPAVAMNRATRRTDADALPYGSIIRPNGRSRRVRAFATMRVWGQCLDSDGSMVDFLLGLVEWIAVPLIMISGLLIAARLAKGTTEPGARIGAWAGLLAGLVAGSGFAITQLPGGRSAPAGEEFHFSLLALLIGLVAGFGLPYLVRLVRRAPQGLTGVLTLTLSASSSLAILNYLFNGSARDFTVLLAVSLLFGVLLWATFNGGSVPELLAGPRPRSRADTTQGPYGYGSPPAAGSQYGGAPHHDAPDYGTPSDPQ